MKRGFTPTRIVLLGAALLTVVLCVLILCRVDRPLSPLETRLVGRWTESGAFAIVYSPDRRMWTSDGQFTGRWWIDEEGLKVRCWQEEGSGSGLSGFFSRIRMQVEAPVDRWSIEFGEDDRVVTLVAPDNKAVMTRLSDP